MFDEGISEALLRANRGVLLFVRSNKLPLNVLELVEGLVELQAMIEVSLKIWEVNIGLLLITLVFSELVLTVCEERFSWSWLKDDLMPVSVTGGFNPNPLNETEGIVGLWDNIFVSLFSLILRKEGKDKLPAVVVVTVVADVNVDNDETGETPLKNCAKFGVTDVVESDRLLVVESISSNGDFEANETASVLLSKLEVSACDVTIPLNPWEFNLFPANKSLENVIEGFVLWICDALEPKMENPFEFDWLSFLSLGPGTPSGDLLIWGKEKELNVGPSVFEVGNKFFVFCVTTLVVSNDGAAEETFPTKDDNAAKGFEDKIDCEWGTVGEISS